MSLFATEEERLAAFPVARERIFVAHAGVTILPSAAANAMQAHVRASCEHHQEFGSVLKDVGLVRALAARWIGKKPEEVALLGPTSLGLSLFANGIEWKAGDEVLIYGDDYPANVYPWLNLQRHGVRVRLLRPTTPGRIEPEMVQAELTPHTKLVALASCHFLTGWRIDIPAISRLLRHHGVLFSLDAIQTIGAFPTPAEDVDFLSADAHKWMLGPLAIGIVAVAEERFATCRPTLLGAWNVESPDFITQEEIKFVPTAQRYEPGVLNITGIYGMQASLAQLENWGLERVSSAILDVRDYLEAGLADLGWKFLSPRAPEPWRSGILTARPPTTDPARVWAALEKNCISASLRKDRSGQVWLRFSPHCYNTRAEMDQILEVLGSPGGA
jgi:cysteine desulfurase/selenocysteine lyase